MADEWEAGPSAGARSNQPNQEDLEKRIEEITRTVVQGANEAQQRIKRVLDKTSEYRQQTQTTPVPRKASSVEEQRIRQLANMWSAGNWRVARDLGTYMDVVSWSSDEVWEVTLQTLWETRNMEQVTEPYTGRQVGKLNPVLPVWDYDLPAVTGLKAPPSRTRLEGLDEIVACTVCNGTGRALCTVCTGRGWIVCPKCKGRTKIRCITCRGRGYIADWTQRKKKPFIQKQPEDLAASVTEKVSDVFEGIRQQGVPDPNPADIDPASKGQTVPCPDCVNGEMDCTCGNGKRVCTNCQGAKTALCANCGGTGKVVRHREIVRRFDLRVQTQVVGNNPIPEQRLLKASGEPVYNAEVNETLPPAAPPEGVSMDVWQVAVGLVQTATANREKAGSDPQGSSRMTLQVLELVRIPYSKIDYRFENQDFVFYVYDSEGKEKYYAERYPARWDRIERLVRSITNDLMTPAQDASQTSDSASGYRVPVEMPPYTITEEDEDEHEQGTFLFSRIESIDAKPIERLELFAVARAELEEDERAIVGKSYSAQAGISQSKPENFEVEQFDISVRTIDEPLPFDILLHASKNIELLTEWQKHLRYNPRLPEPQLVEFTFRVIVPGLSSLDFNFYHERRWLRTIHFEIDAIEQSQPASVSVEG